MGEIVDLNLDNGNIEENMVPVKVDHEALINRAEELVKDANRDISELAYISMPLAQIASLGAGVAQLLPVFQNVAQNAPVGTETLYRVANAGVGDALKMAKDGNFWGAMKTADGASKMVKLQAVKGVETAGAAVAVNPAVIMVAVALFAIEQQVGKITDMEKQIISFLEVEKESGIEADLQTLEKMLRQFKLSWDNENFVKSNHELALQIKRTANKNLVSYQKKLDEALGKIGHIVKQSKVSSVLQDMLKQFQYYRMSLFTVSMSSLLDVMLSGNFNEEYISGIIKEIETESMKYRERFTKCSDYLERLSDASISKQLRQGLGGAGVAVGKVIGKIPLVEKGPVDEYLQDVGKSMQDGAEEMVDKAVQMFSQVRDPGTAVFMEKLDDMIQIYNHTSDICFDGENLYLIAG